MHVLVAPDKFKGCRTAREVAAHLSAGLRAVLADVEIVVKPVADGGDGFLDAAAAAGYGLHRVRARGPTGEPVDAAYARRGEAAIVELASVCGLSRLPGGRPEPLRSSSFGVGQVLAATLDLPVRQVVLGIGGSASTDGGAGMLQALGADLRDTSGRPLAPGGAALAAVASLDLSRLHPGLATTDVSVACDVDSPLTGPRGAAAVFGPQKGASTQDVARLEAGLRRWAGVVAAATGRDRSGDPGSGAAGGVGFAAVAVLGATLRPGIAVVLELLGFDRALAGACLVITGEGAMDAQTLSGKAPGGVARAAASAGVPVVAVAGRCGLSPAELDGLGIRRVYTLSELEPDRRRSIAGAGVLIERTGMRIARDWLLPARAGGLPGAPPGCGA